MFTKVEKTKTDQRYSLTEEQFHGCSWKRIKEACAQLIEGSCAFRLLYNIKEGEHNVELVLKPSCWGKETLSSYIAGVYFTEDDIRTFGHNKKVNVCALWAMGLTVLQSIKKALSIIPKLSPRIVTIDKNWAVIGYASGKNEHSFMQLVDNGMYAMASINGDDELIVDKNDESDDDNKFLGAVSEAGMPMTREDDALIKRVRAKTVEGLPIRPGSTRRGDVDVQAGDMSAKNDNDCNDVVEEQTNPIELECLDPFQHGGFIATEGFTYIGKLSFICFGPTPKFCASTLAIGGQSNRTVEENREGLRKAQRKVNTERANTDMEVGIDRGMTLNA